MSSARIDFVRQEVLFEGWSRVVRIFYRFLHGDGREEFQDRELLDRGDGVSVLLHNPKRGTILLLEQPRITALQREGGTGRMIEACNGQVGNEDPIDCARREVEEETGHRPLSLEAIGKVYPSPGASLELVHLYLGEYNDDTLVSTGGGLAAEGEEIDLIEVSVNDAIDMVDNHLIRDGRTILALHFAFRRGFLQPTPPSPLLVTASASDLGRTHG